MALVTTLGSSIANSFCTVVEADEILLDAPFDTTAWTALDSEYETPQKEWRLIAAATAMGFLPLRGYRMYTEQALCFPRTWRVLTTESYDDLDTGRAIIEESVWSWFEMTEIPAAAKEAQAYAAVLGAHRGLVSLKPAANGIPGQQVKAVSLGGMLNVTFGEGLPNYGSSLMQIFMNPDFPVYIKLAPYLAKWRSRGSGDRPTLKDKVVDAE